MQNAKITLFLDLSSNGWSETYYAPAASLEIAEGLGISLVEVRTDLLGEPATIAALRVNDVDVIRASRIFPLAATSTGGYISQADIPENAAMMRLFSASDNRSRAVYFRGNPDDVYDREDPNNVDAQKWNTKFQAMGDFLRGVPNGPAWLIKDKPRPIFQGVGKNVIDVVGIAPDVVFAGRLAITTLGDHNLNPGDSVSFYKMKIPRLSGNFTVVSTTDATHFTVGFHLPSGYVYGGAGSFLKYTAAYPPITQFAPEARFTGKKTGRPFELTRGRRVSIPR